MINRQRIAKWFLTLACLVVLTCLTQRMAGLHTLQLALGLPTVSVSQSSASGDEEATTTTPCELSAKSLLASAPVMFENVLFGLGMLLVLLAPDHRSTPAVPSRTRYFPHHPQGPSAIMRVP